MVVDISVALVEDWEKPMLRINLTIAAATVGATAGRLSLTRPRAAQGLLAAHHVVAGAAAARRIDARAVPSTVAACTGITAGVAAVGVLHRQPSIRTELLAVATIGAAATSARRSQQRRRAALDAASETVAVPVPATRLRRRFRPAVHRRWPFAVVHSDGVLLRNGRHVPGTAA
ncbi:hypothetical protein AB0L40_05075 [Patulibacter sp. NPDC049589]|uniref:hypothetical protein n=1 Tax=Patulibacter sp. NPDC049589 TaxID=3154731 RepID=UPI00341CFBFF